MWEVLICGNRARLHQTPNGAKESPEGAVSLPRGRAQYRKEDRRSTHLSPSTTAVKSSAAMEAATSKTVVEPAAVESATVISRAPKSAPVAPATPAAPGDRSPSQTGSGTIRSDIGVIPIRIPIPARIEASRPHSRGLSDCWPRPDTASAGCSSCRDRPGRRACQSWLSLHGRRRPLLLRASSWMPLDLLPLEFASSSYLSPLSLKKTMASGCTASNS